MHTEPLCLQEPSPSCQRLNVRPHHALDAADFREAPELVHSTAALLPVVTERLQGDIETNLVSIFKAVGDCFRRFVNFHCDAFDGVFFDAFRQSLSRHPYEAKGLPSLSGRPRFSVESKPNL